MQKDVWLILFIADDEKVYPRKITYRWVDARRSRQENWSEMTSFLF